MTIFGYIRVSTDKQTTENQRFEIERHLCTQGIAVDIWINETVSGTVDFKKRQLGKVMKRIKSGDVLVCSELSRLGRNLFQIMTILNFCMTKNAQVWTIKESYRLGTDLQSKILAFAFGISAELERVLISQRTKEALNLRKAQGKPVGRQPGAMNKRHILDGREKQIETLLKQGISKSKITKILKIGSSTLYSFLRKNNLL